MSSSRTPLGFSITASRFLPSCLAALLLASCGGSTGSAPPPPPATVAPPALPATVTPGATPGTVGDPQAPPETGLHIAIGQAGAWAHDPPSSGQHWPVTAPWGLARQAYPPELWVHNLEHGGVAVLYRDGSGSAIARSFVQRAPREVRFGEQKLLDAPYSGLQHPFALVAWGWLLYLDRWDDRRALDFYAAHVDQGPENLP